MCELNTVKMYTLHTTHESKHSQNHKATGQKMVGLIATVYLTIANQSGSQMTRASHPTAQRKLSSLLWFSSIISWPAFACHTLTRSLSFPLPKQQKSMPHSQASKINLHVEGIKSFKMAADTGRCITELCPLSYCSLPYIQIGKNQAIPPINNNNKVKHGSSYLQP